MLHPNCGAYKDENNMNALRYFDVTLDCLGLQEEETAYYSHSNNIFSILICSLSEN